MPPLTAAPLPTYNDAYSSLGSIYDPQVQAVQAQEAPQMSALDQAKVNAFKDIGNEANAKGMLFSGFTPDQEATYTGTKYLPAVANLKAGITGAVNKLNAERGTQAQDIVTKGQQAANDAAYKNAQLALSYARLNKPSGSGGLTAYEQIQLLNQQQNQFKIAGKGWGNDTKSFTGGYNFTGANGRPVNMATYAQGANLGGQDIISLLSGGSSYDKWVLGNVAKSAAGKTAIQNEDVNGLVNAIKKYDTGKYYGF